MSEEAEPGEGKALSLDIEDVGKRIKSSKKRVTFKFCFFGSNEHTVVLTHSVMSGKKRIEVDGRLVFESKEVSIGEFRHPFRLKKHLLSIIIDGEEYEYDLLVDGRPFRQLPRISFLDMRAARLAAKEAPAKATPTGGRRKHRASSGSVKEMDFNTFVSDGPTPPRGRGGSDVAAAPAAAGDDGFDPFNIGGDDAGGASNDDPFGFGAATTAPAAAPAPAPTPAPAPAFLPPPATAATAAAAAPAAADPFDPFAAPTAPAAAVPAAVNSNDPEGLFSLDFGAPVPSPAGASVASSAFGSQVSVPTSSAKDLTRLVNMDNLLQPSGAPGGPAIPARPGNVATPRRMSLAARQAQRSGAMAGGDSLFGGPVASSPAPAPAVMAPNPSMVYMPSPARTTGMGGMMGGGAAPATTAMATDPWAATAAPQPPTAQFGAMNMGTAAVPTTTAQPQRQTASVNVDPFAGFM